MCKKCPTDYKSHLERPNEFTRAKEFISSEYLTVPVPRIGCEFQELFEILRVEKGIPIAPNELNDKHNPLETTQTASAVSFTKGCYIGQEVIARLDAQGKVQRQLVGLKFGDSLPSTGDRISDESLAGVSPLGDEIGEITSIANSPSFGNIGLGYVRAKHANPGKVVSVKDSEGNKFSATLVKLPFDD